MLHTLRIHVTAHMVRLLFIPPSAEVVYLAMVAKRRLPPFRRESGARYGLLRPCSQ